MRDFLEPHGVHVIVGDRVARFDRSPEGKALTATTQCGSTHPVDLVVLSLGVRPDTELAQHAVAPDRVDAGTR